MDGLQMRYFVLKPRGDSMHAAASRKAIRAYAQHIQTENPQLAAELRNWADREGADILSAEEAS